MHVQGIIYGLLANSLLFLTLIQIAVGHPCPVYSLTGAMEFHPGADPILGQVGWGWALEISSFLSPKWHSPIGSMPFHRAPKSLDFQGPSPLT
jgi:hypothetical protein